MQIFYFIIPKQQNINYTSRPLTITEDGYSAQFTYEADGDRVKMQLTQNGAPVFTRHYLANQYELDEKPGSSREKLYLGGDYYNAGAVLVRDNGGAWQVFYINSDYLGSVTHIVNSAGAVVAEYSYDAWGRLRDPGTQAVYAVGAQPELFLGRGYTGHEHLNWFGLINMNARLYHPVHGRFLAPDPYVQEPDFTQSFNRYGYAFNNPLSFNDATGEIAWFIPIIIGAAIFGTGNVAIQAINGNINNFWDGLEAFGAGVAVGAVAGATWSFGLAALNGTSLVKGSTIISGITHKTFISKAASWMVLGAKAVSVTSTILSAMSNPGNAFKLALGKTYFDEREDFFGQVVQGVSRYTWEGIQTWVGYNYSQIRNIAGKTDRVDYFGGATFSTSENVRDFGNWEGASHGNYIFAKISNRVTGNFRNFVLANPLYMHEYGHTFDSRRQGLAYYFTIGIPSARGARWTEVSANRHAADYFEYFGVDWARFSDRYPLN